LKVTIRGKNWSKKSRPRNYYAGGIIGRKGKHLFFLGKESSTTKVVGGGGLVSHERKRREKEFSNCRSKLPTEEKKLSLKVGMKLTEEGGDFHHQGKPACNFVCRDREEKL